MCMQMCGCPPVGPRQALLAQPWPPCSIGHPPQASYSGSRSHLLSLLLRIPFLLPVATISQTGLAGLNFDSTSCSKLLKRTLCIFTGQCLLVLFLGLERRVNPVLSNKTQVSFF